MFILDQSLNKKNKVDFPNNALIFDFSQKARETLFCSNHAALSISKTPAI